MSKCPLRALLSVERITLEIPDGEAVLVGQELAVRVEVVPESVQSERDIREEKFARHHGERRVLDVDSPHGCNGRDFLDAVVVEQGLENGDGALHSDVENLIDTDFLNFWVVHAEHPNRRPQNPVNLLILRRAGYPRRFSPTIFKTDSQSSIAIRWPMSRHRRPRDRGPSRSRRADQASHRRGSIGLRNRTPLAGMVHFLSIASPGTPEG